MNAALNLLLDVSVRNDWSGFYHLCALRRRRTTREEAWFSWSSSTKYTSEGNYRINLILSIIKLNLFIKSVVKLPHTIQEDTIYLRAVISW